MKKIVVVMLIICTFVTYSYAELVGEGFPFGLTNKSTYEDVLNKMITTFGEGEEKSDNYNGEYYAISPSSARFLGWEIDDIMLTNGGKRFSFYNAEWVIEFKLSTRQIDNSAHIIHDLYNELCSIHGIVFRIDPYTYNYDFNGNEEMYDYFEQEEELQNLIDLVYSGNSHKESIIYSDSLFITYYWTNCSMQLYVGKESLNVTVSWGKYNPDEDEIPFD